MKIVYRDSIENIDWTDLFDNKLLFNYFIDFNNSADVLIYDMSVLLKQKENTDLLNNLSWKFAMYSNVYSPESELEIFTELFNYAINNNVKIHINWVTLREELELIESYYESLWFLRDDINCFAVDFSIPLVTVSVNIENLIWRWSDYKSYREKIFFIPPVRESWQNKAMFKWINRWVIAWINIVNFTDDIEKFLSESVVTEKILPLTLSKVLKYNLEDIWFKWINKELVVSY